MQSNIVWQVLARRLFALALACFAAGAMAGADPTAPPPGLMATTDGLVRAPARAASAAHAASAAAAAVSRVESVRFGGERPATALVDGHMLAVGDRLGDAVVTSIDEQGVLLRSTKGASRLLALAPGIHKTPVAMADGDGGDSRRPVTVATRHKDSQ
jgi:hypothetical protein